MIINSVINKKKKKNGQRLRETVPYRKWLVIIVILDPGITGSIPRSGQ